MSSMKTIGAILLTMLLGTAQAEVLLIDAIDQAESVERPQNGVSKADTLNKYGEPQQRFGPVGDPPIERWVYEGFTVYFEYDLVIHSVAHRPKPASE